LIHHPIKSGAGFVYALVRPQDIALISQFAWRWQDGEAITDLCDMYLLTVSMDRLIAHPELTSGSHSVN
jgi:hypothetical protein